MSVPAPVAPNVARIAVTQYDTVAGKRIENIFHAHNVGGWDATSLELLAAAVRDWWTTNVKPLVPSNIELIDVTCTDLTDLDHDRYVETVAPPVAGTNVGACLPGNVTMAVKANTGKRGRGRAGRTFIPALTEPDVTSDTVSSAVASSWIAALNLLIDAVGGLTGSPQLVVLHRIVDKVKQAVQTWDAILGFSVTDLLVDSMKNRLEGHKRHKRTKILP